MTHTAIYVAGTFAALVVLGAASDEPGSEPARQLAPCATDESESAYPCYWDAAMRGNGQGTSFVLLDRDGDGYATDLTYLP